MSSTSFTFKSTVIPSVWLNDVNTLVWGVFNGASTAALARTALGLGTISLLNSPLPIANGGTSATTAAGAITALGAVDITTTQNIDGTKHFVGSDTLVNGNLTVGPGVFQAPAGTFTGLLTTDGQVKFPSTQNPSSDANTLDDYVEGTFSPVLAFGGASVGITYTDRAGKYTKIGNVVHFSIRINLSSKGSSTGNSTISGLPYTNSSAVDCIFTAYVNNMSSGYNSATGITNSSGTVIQLSNLATGTQGLVTNTGFTDASLVIVTGFILV